MTKAEILEKVEELYESSKLPDLEAKLSDIEAVNKILGLKKEEEEKKVSPVVWVFAILGVIVVIAGIAYLCYRYFEPDYLEDFDDEFDEEFDDEFFEDEEDDSESEAEDK